MRNHLLMFHYFHDGIRYKKVQGSISGIQLEKIITSTDYNVLSAEVWIESLINNKLKENDVCLSFDDGLKEQFDIALPVLEKFNLKGIFNINTGSLEYNNKLEIIRYFRNYFFNDVEEFYSFFFKNLEKRYDISNILASVDFNNYLSDFDFYTYSDRKFRYFRDEFLKDNYNNFMDSIIAEFVDAKEILEKCCLSRNDIKVLAEKDHIVGLHTHSHPTDLRNMNYNQQKAEFYKNYETLKDIINKDIHVVAYPCGTYNKYTISVMRELGIDIGMISSINKINSDFLTLGRIDSCNIVRDYAL